MIFFVAMPFVTGLMNYVVPLQIGARDVSFPFLNNFSFWMTASGAALVMASLFVGEFAQTGWLAYPPLSGLAYSPDVGVDYYIWSLQIAGVGTTLSGINLIATIVKMRAPGMTMMRPVFTWTSLCTNVLIVASFPVLTAVLAAQPRPLRRHQLLHERRRQPDDVREPDLDLGPPGGLHPDPADLRRLLEITHLLRQAAVRLHLDGLCHRRHHHPVLPRVAAPLLHDGFGRQRQQLLRHHHDGHLDPDRREDLQLAVHDVPRRIRFDLPMMWTVAFMLTFVIGGMTGVMLAVPPADFVLHNSLFLIAHFHNVIIGGVVFGVFAAINYWWPKAFGFKLTVLGQGLVLVLVVGFWLAFTPLYVLGLMGVTRRMRHFDDPSLQIWFQIAAAAPADRAGHRPC
jgi:cytochrome o ubiquinol oxidase subunit 1